MDAQPLSGVYVSLFGLKIKLFAWPTVMVGVNATGQPVPLLLQNDGSMTLGNPVITDSVTGIKYTMTIANGVITATPV